MVVNISTATYPMSAEALNAAQACSLLPQQQPLFFFAPKQPIQPPLNANMNPLLEQKLVLAMQHHGYMPDKSNSMLI
jgi:hypothetical protein